MFKNFKLLLTCVLSLSLFQPVKAQSSLEKINHKNPFVWVYAAGVVSGLLALHAKYIAEYPIPPYSFKSRDVDVLLYSAIAGILIVGTTTDLILGKTLRLAQDYFKDNQKIHKPVKPTHSS